MHYKPEYSEAFRVWLDTSVGSRFLHLESEVVNLIVPTLFGYNAVILGAENFSNCLMASKIKQKIIVNLDSIIKAGVCARQDKLPILSEGIDLVYLAHCLEFTNNPHEVLREAYRVLRPDGHVIISMFNPLSAWGIWGSVAKWGGNTPWVSNFMSLIKLKDWLALLGFDIMRVKHFGYNLPLNSNSVSIEPSWLEKFGQKLNLPCGAGFVIEASKRVIPITPIRPVWASEEKIISNDLVEPTV